VVGATAAQPVPSTTLDAAVWLLWRLTRILGIFVVIGLLVLLFTTIGRAIAPHAEVALTAANYEREEVEFVLDPGAQRTIVYDRHGGVMGELRSGTGNRELVELGQIPDEVIGVILAVEDEKFYEHKGFNGRGILRAAVSNVSQGGVSQGGSTITQQIVKDQFVGSERTLTRKLREAAYATRLEEQYTKDELLEFYLNSVVYFGNGAYGIQAAAETYFGKNAAELDAGDAALLAGLIRSPSVFDGFEAVDEARSRRTSSLQRAVEAGVITEAQRLEFEERPLPSANLSPSRVLKRDYALDAVQESLTGLEVLGATVQERNQRILTGGLRVYTTYDPQMQRMAEEARAEVFPQGLGDFQVSLAAIDHNTGAVRAFLAGDTFSEEQFNLATQGRRQPGSSFKTYVLAAAFEYGGYLPNDILSGTSPCEFDVGANEPYKVSNYGRGGRVGTIRSQTLSSSNCAFVRLGLASGLANVSRTATELIGREEPFPQVASMSIGSLEVTPLEQAIGHGTIANGGIRMEPYYVERIEDRDGNVLYEHLPSGHRVLSEETALRIQSVLADNVTGGTGGRAQLENQVAAGKTGTNQRWRDAWFVGWTPQLTTATWMGHPDQQVSMMNVFGLSNITGGSLPAQLWSAFMERALAGTEPQPFAAEPPSPRAGKLVFVDGDRCPVSFNLQDGSSIRFTLDCELVNTSEDGFSAREEATCTVPVLQPDGSTVNQEVPCNQVGNFVGTTTTTTTTTAPPPTTTEPPRPKPKPEKPAPRPTTTAPATTAPPTTAPPPTTTTAPPGDD
jgi:penicillin-binding protein 1A